MTSDRGTEMARLKINQLLRFVSEIQKEMMDRCDWVGIGDSSSWIETTRSRQRWAGHDWPPDYWDRGNRFWTHLPPGNFQGDLVGHSWTTWDPKRNQRSLYGGMRAMVKMQIVFGWKFKVWNVVNRNNLRSSIPVLLCSCILSLFANQWLFILQLNVFPLFWTSI